MPQIPTFWVQSDRSVLQAANVAPRAPQLGIRRVSSEPDAQNRPSDFDGLVDAWQGFEDMAEGKVQIEVRIGMILAACLKGREKGSVH